MKITKHPFDVSPEELVLIRRVLVLGIAKLRPTDENDLRKNMASLASLIGRAERDIDALAQLDPDFEKFLEEEKTADRLNGR